MRKLTLFLVALSLVVSCARTDKQAVRIGQPEPSSTTPFGPFFLPENHSLSSVSLNFVTSTPQETTVYFTMVGEIDWARNDKTQTRFHRMVFKDLEESAVYQFTIKCNDREIGSFSSIQTMPFGDEYQFKFAVATMDGELDNSVKPHFIVLGSGKNSVDEKEFHEFYAKNRETLSSTILIPMFNLQLQGADVDLAGEGGGIYFIRYKNLCLTLISREQANYDFITRFISDAPEDKNVIVVSHLEKRSVEELSRRVALLNCRIYSFISGTAQDVTADNLTLVNGCQVVDIIKKQTYALVLTNEAR